MGKEAKMKNLGNYILWLGPKVGGRLTLYCQATANLFIK